MERELIYCGVDRLNKAECDKTAGSDKVQACFMM